MHANPIADELTIGKVIIPRHPGNFSAFGLLTSDLRHDYVRTYLTELRDADISRIRDLQSEMTDDGQQALLREGLTADSIRMIYSADMRYSGQAFELRVPIAGNNLELPDFESAFHETYRKAYGHSREGKEVELVNLRLAAFGAVDKPALSGGESGDGKLSGALKGKRPVYFEGSFLDCPIYDRGLLHLGASVNGPAVVEELGSTTVLFPGWKASVDHLGSLILGREG
jgi:N-methylhydantoinase A